MFWFASVGVPGTEILFWQSFSQHGATVTARAYSNMNQKMMEERKVHLEIELYCEVPTTPKVWWFTRTETIVFIKSVEKGWFMEGSISWRQASPVMPKTSSDACDLIQVMRGKITCHQRKFDDGRSDPNNVESEATGSKWDPFGYFWRPLGSFVAIWDNNPVLRCGMMLKLQRCGNSPPT